MKLKGAAMLPEDLIALGGGGWIGVVVAAIFGGIYAFRRIYHQDKVSGANASASVDVIKRMYDLLDLERSNLATTQALLAQANERADAANRERIEMVLEVGKLRQEIAELRTEVRMLREQK